MSLAECRAGRPVKVLFVVDSLWGAGGAEMCLLRLTRSLPRDRYSCHVITFHTNEFARPFLNRFDCPIHHWQLKNVRNLNAWKVALRLFRFIRREKIEVVHTFFRTADLWAAPIARLAGAKVLISSRRDMGILRYTADRIGYRLLRGLFTQIQTVSDEVKRFTIEAENAKPESVVTIHNGIETMVESSEVVQQEVRRGLGIPMDRIVVSCVANVRRVKGVDVFLKAAELVHRQMPGVHFLVVGHHTGMNAERIYIEELLRLQESLETTDYVHFVGHTDQVNQILDASNIFVLPSRSEGLSNALLEAMRAGLPCVATAVGGNPEVVVDGRTGFLVPSGCPDKMADSILRLIRDPGLRCRMGAAGRQRIIDKFSVEAMASAVAGEYDRLLDRPSCQRYDSVQPYRPIRSTGN